MTIKKGVAKALEAVIAGEKVDKRLLESEAVRNALTTFFFEKDVRPELVGCIHDADLMNDYLALSVESREAMEEIREKKPGFFEGDLEADINRINLGGYISKLGTENFEKIRNILYEINALNILPEIVNQYVLIQSKNKEIIPELTTWFTSYDIYTGACLIFREKKKLKILGKPQGNKIFNRWCRYKGREEGADFEKWVLQRIPKKLVEEYKELKAKVSTKNLVKGMLESYISEAPLSARGYSLVPTQEYCRNNSFSIDERIIPGTTILSKWVNSKEKDIDFEKWVLDQVPKKLLKEYKKLIGKFSIENIAEELLKYFMIEGPIKRACAEPLKAYCRAHKFSIEGKTIDGSSIISSWWYYSNGGKDTDFESWILSKASDKMANRYSGFIKCLNKFSEYKLSDMTPSLYEITVKNYIEQVPLMNNQLVPIDVYCNNCDIGTGEFERVDSRKKLSAKVLIKVYEEKGEVTFEEWLLSKVSEELSDRYQELKDKFSIDNLISFLLESYMSETSEGELNPVSIKQYSMGYKIPIGKRRVSGASVYHRWLSSKERKEDIEFEQWLLSKVTEDLAEKYIAYNVSQRAIRLEIKKKTEDKELKDLAEIVIESIITNHPISRCSLVTIEVYSQSYDIATGKRMPTESRKINANKLYCFWYKEKENIPGKDFDEWVMTLISDELNERYQTLKGKFSIGSMIAQTLKDYMDDPEIDYGRFSIKEYFKTHKIEIEEESLGVSGIPLNWRDSKERKEGIEFEPWLLSYVSEELADNYNSFIDTFSTKNIAIKLLEDYIAENPDDMSCRESVRVYGSKHRLHIGGKDVPASVVVSKFYNLKDQKKGVTFEEWLLFQVPKEDADRYRAYI